MKYIRIDVKLGEHVTKALVITFPNDLVHKDVADAMRMVARRSFGGKVTSEVVSAGEINATADSTHGHSESIGIKADKNDAGYFNMADYGGNIL